MENGHSWRLGRFQRASYLVPLCDGLETVFERFLLPVSLAAGEAGKALGGRRPRMSESTVCSPRTSYPPVAISIPVAVSKRFSRESGSITFQPYAIN
jgi:hypothetical protein